MWAEDFYLLPLARSIGSRPALLWAYQPWRRLPEYLPFLQVLRGSGPVGSLEGMGTLKNLEFPYLFTYGSPEDPRVQAEILQAGRAAWLQRALRSARIGLLPYRNEQMQSTFVDEFRLLRDLGLSIQHLSIGDLVRTSESLLDIEVEDFTNALLRDFPLHGVTRETLAQAARVSLALAYLAAENGLDVLSYNDIAPETHQVFGMRPCLYPPLYDQAGVLVTLEGDLGAASAALIMNRLTGSPIFFTEFWFWDEDENILVGGHGGPQNPAVASGDGTWISQDYEFAQTDRTEGAHLQFVARPGRVSLLQLRCKPGGWQAILATGQALESAPRLEGYPHAIIRLDAPVGQFLRQAASVGTTQHWIMVYGEPVEELRIFCQLANIDLEVIRNET